MDSIGESYLEQVAQLTHIWERITDSLDFQEIHSCRQTSRTMQVACDGLILYPTLQLLICLDRDDDTEIELVIPIYPIQICKSTADAKSYGVVCERFMADILQYLDSFGIMHDEAHFSMGYIDYPSMKFYGMHKDRWEYEQCEPVDGMIKGIHRAIVDHHHLHKHNKLIINIAMYLAGNCHNSLYKIVDDILTGNTRTLTHDEEADIMKTAVEMSHKYFQY